MIVTTNQFGDILTDIGAGLVGGLGLRPDCASASVRRWRRRRTARRPTSQARNIANPYAMIMSGQMLLAWLGRKRNEPTGVARQPSASRRRSTQVIAERKHLTRDLGGQASTHRDGRRHRRRRAMIGKANDRRPQMQEAKRVIGKTGGAALPACGCAAVRRGARGGASLAAEADQDDRSFPAGGGTDFIGAACRQASVDRLGQQVFVENRGGANGAIGLQALMQADPDGYTIATSSDTPLVVNPWLYDKLPYQPLRDFVPVATLVRFPGMLAVHPSVPGSERGRADRARKGKTGKRSPTPRQESAISAISPWSYFRSRPG